MKRILLTAVSLVFAFIGMAQSVTIDIQKRPKPQQELEMVKSTDNDLWKYGISSDTIYTHSKLPRQFVADGHALINCVHTAYADHRPLVLSPDMLWLVIAQGFAVHVNNNAEKLRPKLVKFDGKKELIVIVEPGLLYNKDGKAWEPYFESFADQMAKFTGQGLIDLMTCDFSTSTPASVAASQMVLMSAMQKFFNYTMIDQCGIPQVTLEGTPEDWQHLVEKANALRMYGLDWWIDRLEPVLKKLAAAANGEVDLDFWKSICKSQSLGNDDEEIGCGYAASTKINGWIVKFYPYDGEGKRNNLREFDDGDIINLPTEMASAPLRYIELRTNTVHHLEIHAGLAGYTENPTTKALRPFIAWVITSPNQYRAWRNGYESED